MKHKILAIDDDEVFLKSLEKILKLNNFNVALISNPLKVIDFIKVNSLDCVITDVKMPGMNGIDLQKEICKIDPGLPIIAISGQSNISNAVEMIKNGAYDFIEKPVDEERLIVTINNAIEKQTILEANKNIFTELKENYRMIGQSDEFNEIIENINIIAPTNARVLITGETGTGKELVAWAIHHNSKRKNKPYLKLNCASIPSELLESELFGHKKGSFTGADRDRTGKFMAANGGTLFLDEIGEMDFSLQSKLLRVLEENEIELIGENSPKKIDVRIVAATNKNLKEEIRKGNFRDDLFHRINVFEIYIPPLSQRKKDILPLSYHFVKIFSEMYNKKVLSISAQVEGLLLNQEWNGNIRELKNCIEKLVIFSTGNEITVNIFYKAMGNGHSDYNNLSDKKSFKTAKENFEKELILKTLTDNNWIVKNAAEELGLERTNLFKKMQKYGIRK
ncbi:MAG: sigma-54 dependent transcriptional regulator [Flavobacteriaceae bacterium]|nr:sigma-54 dependent transcriptional regulator [Flavobacteriaceae bacterium]